MFLCLLKLMELYHLHLRQWCWYWPPLIRLNFLYLLISMAHFTQFFFSEKFGALYIFLQELIPSIESIREYQKMHVTPTKMLRSLSGLMDIQEYTTTTCSKQVCRCWSCLSLILIFRVCHFKSQVTSFFKNATSALH